MYRYFHDNKLLKKSGMCGQKLFEDGESRRPGTGHGGGSPETGMAYKD